MLDKNSPAAAVFELFSRRLYATVRQAAIPAAARAVVPGNLVSLRKIIDWMYAPDGRFGADPIKARDALVATSFEEGVAEATKRFGPDMAAWKWGDEKLHHALIRHPLSNAVNAEMKKKLEVGPLPRGGDGNTVSATGGSDNQMSGGSLKIIADAQDWDNSVGLNTPGQSGDPDDPHYRDLFELWARGPLLPGGLLARQGGVGGRAHHVADAGGGVDLRRAAVDQGRTAAPASSNPGGGGRLPPPPHAALGGAHCVAVGHAAGQRGRSGRAQHLPHPGVQHVEAVVVDAAGLEVGSSAAQ